MTEVLPTPAFPRPTVTPGTVLRYGRRYQAFRDELGAVWFWQRHGWRPASLHIESTFTPTEPLLWEGDQA